MERFPTEIVCPSPEETSALGERLAGILGPGSVVALYGGLGVGKTCLAAGIARGLGVIENVTSPTYTVVREYVARPNDGGIPLYHVDAYRLNGDGDFEETGAREFMDSGGITVVEWSERVPGSIPDDAIKVEISITDSQDRVFRIRGGEYPARANA